MNKEQLIQPLKLCKYYHGEKECPYADRNSQLWWGGEKVFVERCDREKHFFEQVKSEYRNALEKAQVSHMLADTRTEENKRVLVFFLDLWHGKWFPHDSLDAIFDY